MVEIVGRPVIELRDSGLGVVIALKEVMRVMNEKNIDAAIIAVADDPRGSYGNQPDDVLFDLCGHLAKVATFVGADVNGGACNTYHWALRLARRRGPHASYLFANPRYVNLIRETSREMIRREREEGDVRPSLLATAKTVESGMYYMQLAELGSALCPTQVAAPTLAARVNALEHLHSERAEYSALVADVRERIANVPKDATSLGLCCTHFPVLSSLIRAELSVRGMRHVKVWNPMTVQAEALAREVRRLALAGDRFVRGAEVRSMIITAGPQALVQSAANAILGPGSLPVVSTGKPFAEIASRDELRGFVESEGLSLPE